MNGIWYKVRKGAALALGNLGYSDERVRGALVTALKDEEKNVRERVAFALGKLGQRDERVISALIAALKDVWDVRAQATAALINLGYSDERVVAALVDALKDDDSYVRAHAVAVLVNLGQRDEQVIATLVAALKNNNSYVRACAATALGNLGQSDERVIAALLAALKDYFGNVQEQATEALVKLGQRDERVIATLMVALNDNNRYVRQQVAAALGKLLSTQPTDELIKLITHNSSDYRTAGAQALARQYSISRTTLNKINRLQKDERPWVRHGAWEAYGVIQERFKSEKQVKRLLYQADSLFVRGQWSMASDQYESAFYTLKRVIRVDSVKVAYARFQQARCESKQKRKLPTLSILDEAFQYNPALRDTLQAEMVKPENDWKILEGNWYLRDILLKTPKSAQK
ncbi:MAG: HEAT repeat domain-containing protein [Nitrososphaera sp.]